MRLNRLSTVEYGNTVQAQEIAQGGMQDILSDLHQEIVAGSIPDPTGSTYTYGANTAFTNTIYVPNINFTAVPARVGYPNTGGSTAWGTDIAAAKFSPTLVRVSRS